MAFSGPARAAATAVCVLLVDWGLVQLDLSRGPSVTSAIVISFLAAQVGLASTWVAIGRPSRWLVRLSVVVPVGVGIWKVVDNWGPGEGFAWAVVYATQVVIVTGGLLGMCLRGFSMAGVSSQEDAGQPGGAHAGFNSRHDARDGPGGHGRGRCRLHKTICKSLRRSGNDVCRRLSGGRYAPVGRGHARFSQDRVGHSVGPDRQCGAWWWVGDLDSAKRRRGLVRAFSTRRPPFSKSRCWAVFVGWAIASDGSTA